MKKLIIATAALSAVIAATPAAAQTSSSPRATAGARLIKPLILTKDQDLNFGTIVLGSLQAAQTVRLEPTGSITCGTGLTCATTGQAARYTVTGTQGQVVNIRTASPTFNLTTTNGPVGGTLVFTPILAASSLTLGNSGDVGNSFNVGGTITIATDQQDGVYTGDIDIQVSYP